MEIIITILCVIFAIALLVFVYTPIVAWWMQFFTMRKMKKKLKEGGTDECLNAFLQSLQR